MRYRLEVLDNDDIVVHNVETGLILGYVTPHVLDHPHDPSRLNISACTVFNLAGKQIAWISGMPVSDLLSKPAIALATHERYREFAGFRAQAFQPCRPDRIEHQLGVLLADTCAEMARGMIECHGGGLKGETKERYADLIGGLHAIWYSSHFGSFDDEVRTDDLYFSNPTASGPRLSFAQAAQVYGMAELRKRLPDVSHATLRQVLAWPLELLKTTLERLSPATLPITAKV